MKKAMAVFTTIILVAILAIGYLVFKSLTQVSDERVKTTSADLLKNDYLSWEGAVSMIKGCQVTSVSQTHDLEVVLTTKDGKTRRTTEPSIDEVFKVADQAKGRCGDIIYVTQ